MPDETPVMPLHDALDAGDDEPGARKQAINRGKLCINAASPAPRIDADLLAHGVALLHGERYRYESAVRFHAAMNPTGARQTRNVLGGTSENDENNRRGLAAFDAVLAEVEAAGRMRAAITSYGSHAPACLYCTSRNHEACDEFRALLAAAGEVR